MLATNRSKSLYSGFTMIELLVVVAITSILVGLLLPAVQAARETARRTSCLNNQRQLILALQNHEAANRSLPPTLSSNRHDFLLFWQARLLPFLEQAAVYEGVTSEIQHGVSIFGNPYRIANIPTLQCVSNPDQGSLIKADIGFLFAFTDYCGVAGSGIVDPLVEGSEIDNGIFRLKADSERVTRLSEITGGLSNCLIFGERPPSDLDEGFGPWLGGQFAMSASIYTNGSPSSYPPSLNLAGDWFGACGNPTDLSFKNGKRGSRCDWTHHWSFHPDGANFARADGSVAFLSYGIDRKVLADLASRD